MNKKRVKELRFVLDHFFPEVKGEGARKSLLRKLKKEFVRGSYSSR